MIFNICAVMKRNTDIASLFQKHAAKKAAAAVATSNRSQIPDPVELVVEEQTHVTRRPGKTAKIHSTR